LFWYFLYFNQFDEGELCFIRFFLWFNRCDKVFKALVTKRFVSMLNHIWMHCSVIFRLRLYFHVLIYTIIYIFRNILWSGMVCVLPTTKLLFLNKKQSNLKRLSNIMSHIIQVLHILEKQWKVVNKICNYYTYNTVHRSSVLYFLFQLYMPSFCVLCPMLPVSLDGPFLIVTSVFSNVYLVFCILRWTDICINFPTNTSVFSFAIQ
jgi:hypothetical protein